MTQYRTLKKNLNDWVKAEIGIEGELDNGKTYYYQVQAGTMWVSKSADKPEDGFYVKDSKIHEYTADSTELWFKGDYVVNIGGAAMATESYWFEVVPTPEDAKVTLTAAGYKQEGNRILVPSGTEVLYKVEKEGYRTVTDSETITENTSIEVEAYKLCTLTINPTPEDATVLLESVGGEQEDNSITNIIGSDVDITVSKEGYITYTDTVELEKDITIDVELDEAATLTVSPTPNDATVTLEAIDDPDITQVGNAITVPKGHSVHVKVEAEGYVTYSETKDNVETETLEVILELSPVDDDDDTDTDTDVE